MKRIKCITHLFACPGCCARPGCSVHRTRTASSCGKAPSLEQSAYSMASVWPVSHWRNLETSPVHNVQISAGQYCAWSTALLLAAQSLPCPDPRLQICCRRSLTGWAKGSFRSRPSWAGWGLGTIWSLCCKDLLEKAWLCFPHPALPWSRRTALAAAEEASLVQISPQRPGGSGSLSMKSWKNLDLKPLVRIGAYR